MSVDVVMPQMGESIAEGTIVRWIKKVGESIDKDEPLFEISTDKVDAEIPSPGAGVVLEIKVKEGETVPVNSVVAVIGGKGESTSTPSAAAVKAPEKPADRVAPEEPARPQVAAESVVPATPAVSPAPVVPAGAQTVDDLRRTRSSPLVRRIAKEHGLDISRLNGTGISGRVTKKDILAVVEAGPSAAARAGGDGGTSRPAPAMAPPPAFAPGEDVRIEKMSVMRKKIAEHMVMSIHTSPHVYSAYEV